MNTSLFSRQFFALKKGLGVAPALLRSAPAEELILKLIGKDREKFIDDVSQMKGSFVKAAQMLSLYGEHFLPKEMKDFISQVQSEGHYLEWSQLAKLIPSETLSKIEISPQPLAAASIGQVHRGLYQGQEVVLKVQYEGIRQAIDLDLRLLKLLLRSLRILPKKINLDPIYDEIKKNLIREMDYEEELATQMKFKESLQSDHYYIPKAYPEVSSHNVLVSEFCSGALLSSSQVKNLPQEKKNDIAQRIFRLFFLELFELNLIQTDAHPGNFLFDKKTDQLILIDFGSVRSFDKTVIKKYQNLIKSFYLDDESLFKETFQDMLDSTGAVVSIDLDDLWEYCRFVTIPIRQEEFDWSDSTHAEAVYQKAQKTILKADVKTPPHQFLFIDRKVVGLFFLMKTLDAKFNAKSVLAEFIKV